MGIRCHENLLIESFTTKQLKFYCCLRSECVYLGNGFFWLQTLMLWANPSLCSLLKAVHPEQPIGVSLFLLFRGFCSWHLLVAQSFPQWQLSNRYHRSLLKCACPEVLVYLGASPSSRVFLPNGGGKIIPSGRCTHISSSTYTNSASTFFFSFGGGWPLHNIWSLFPCSGGRWPLHTVKSLTFRNALDTLVAHFTNSSPKAFP
jgi:hypothetical protein